jgi:hypothetical protein
MPTPAAPAQSANELSEASTIEMTPARRPNRTRVLVRSPAILVWLQR